MSARRLSGLLLVAALATGLAACGSGDEPKAALGTPENPVVAKTPSEERVTSEGGAKPAEPGYKSLVEQQGDGPAAKDRANPCSLVTKAQAQAILGARLLDPVVAPQGPTCIYRNRSGQSFATVAVQAVNFASLRPRVRRVQRVDVSDRTAYCAMHGQPMLYVPLAPRRVLSVSGRCETAMRFASKAVPRLTG